MIGVLCNALWIAANATGNIKKNQVYGRTLTLLSLPLGYIALRIYANPNIVMALIALMTLVYWLYCVYDIYLQLHFEVKQYFLKSIVPGIGLVTSMAFVGLITSTIVELCQLYMFLIRGTIVVLSGITISYLMLDEAEKSMVKRFAMTLMSKIKKTK